MSLNSLPHQPPAIGHGNPYCDARSGAVLTAGELGLMIFPRKDQPPLRAKARRMCCHWTRLAPEGVIAIEIWQAVKEGLVLSHSCVEKEGIKTQATLVSGLSDAVGCITRFCTNIARPLPRGTARSASMGLSMRGGDLHQRFREAFIALADDVFADWHTIPQLQERT